MAEQPTTDPASEMPEAGNEGALDATIEVLPAWVDALTDGVVLADGGVAQAINAAAAEMLQVDRDRVQGRPLMAVLRDHRMEAAYLNAQEVELHSRGRHLVVRPFAGGLVLQDVSATRRALDDARELLAVLSHELRTPVTTIVASLEALQFDLPEAQRARWMQRAFDEGARLSRLLEDLTVDVAPPRARSLQLRDVIEQAAALLSETSLERSQTVQLEVPASAWVWSDADKLLQVILNLIENALLHGPRAATVTVSAEPDAGREGWWWVEVRDGGEASAPEVMEAWFAPHARGEGATSRGTGLGLYIVRSIASRWGGRAEARARHDGKAIGFSVPRSREAARETRLR